MPDLMVAPNSKIAFSISHGTLKGVLKELTRASGRCVAPQKGVRSHP